MSFILDALNKADHEQEPQGPVPSLRTRYFSPMAEQARQFSPLALGVIAVMAALLLILLLVLLLNRPGAKEPVAAAPVVQVAQSQKVAALTVKPQPTPVLETQASTPVLSEPVQPEPVKSRPDPLIAQLYAAAQQSPQAVQQTSSRPIVIQPTNSPGTLTPERELAIVEAQRLWDESKPKPLPVDLQDSATPKASVEPIVEAIPESIENSVESLAGTPFLHELPVSIQNQIPTLMYAEHEYQDGFVILNKKRYGVGDAVAENVVLHQLLEDGIVMTMEGRQFKLGAQSSWVNF